MSELSYTIDALAEMGASIEFHNRRDMGGEPIADIEVRAGELRGTTFNSQW